MQQHTLSLALFSAVLAASGMAYAAQHQADNDALALEQAHIPLSAAIAAAEQHVGGKASKAEFEHSKKGNYYEVEVVSSARKVFDVRVDADKGSVLSAQEDRADGHGKDEDD